MVSGEIPVSPVYEDTHLLVIEDINPQAPAHFLLFPKKHVRTTLDLTTADNEMIGHLFQVAWTSHDMDETEARARHGWGIAQERIRAGNYDLLILDEFTYPLHYGWLDVGEVIAWLEANKPPTLHLIITGRYAPQALIDYADLVTEMREIKHPFKEQGIRAQAGIEY
jgi:cob(I)alamin adenosyltransferase